VLLIGAAKGERVSFSREEIWPLDTENRFKEFDLWMRENAPAAKHVFVNRGRDFLTKISRDRIEEVLESFEEKYVQAPLEDFDMNNAVWLGKPHPRPMMSCPRIGTRVVSIASWVGFGEFGTVIGTNEVEGVVDVAFDDEVAGGTKLDSQLRTNRGVRMRIDEIVCSASDAQFV
jgi:hypothetical protein